MACIYHCSKHGDHIGLGCPKCNTKEAKLLGEVLKVLSRNRKKLPPKIAEKLTLWESQMRY